MRAATKKRPALGDDGDDELYYYEGLSGVRPVIHDNIQSGFVLELRVEVKKHARKRQAAIPKKSGLWGNTALPRAPASA
jgi:hypothetical protein